jgi:hypothetical protein
VNCVACGAQTVRELAFEAGLDVDEAVLRLLDAGFDTSSPEEKVWTRDIKKVRRLLGLGSSQTSQGDLLEVACLSRRAERPEADVRAVLTRAGILRKSRLKRVPAHLLARAEGLLGLRNPRADERESSY